MPSFFKSSLLCAFLFCLYLPHSSAETSQNKTTAKTYQVEIIVFKNIEPPLNGETFSNYPALPKYEKATELLPTDETLITNYMQLPSEKFNLNREESLISKKENYELLLHESWLQQQNEELIVHVKSDTQRSDLLEGTIHIKRAYYYKANIDFDLQSHSLGGTKHFVLNTKRNLKNNEMHFIDHPQFGILLKITTL
jgi:hypothetical protein